MLRLINSTIDFCQKKKRMMEIAGMNSVMLLFCFVMLQMVSNALSLSLPGNETDRFPLLAFKAQITNDPLNILSSWNQSLHFCDWTGVTCGQRHKRVIKLKLNSFALTGTLSPHIGNLTFLRSIHLQNNSLSGNIPKELGRLFRLQHLRLGNNSFVGEIPVNISGCSNLRQLDLIYNKLTGKLPTELGFLSKMKELYIQENQIIGELPLSLGNLTSLEIFSGGNNGFDGGIPSSIGQLKRLSHLWLGYNNLTGTLPSSLYNLSSLVLLGVEANQLHGSLPSDIGITLSNLELFGIWANNFSGQVPATFSNASKLLLLQLEENKFKGKIPDMSRLTELRNLLVSYNDLGNGEEDDLDFLHSLGNKTNLEVIGIHHNNFGGTIPDIISNFSTNLKSLIFQDNRLHGRIPRDIGNLVGLGNLALGGNHLTGEIPSSIGKLKNLYRLHLYRNKLSGTIPSTIGNLSSLGVLYLYMNNLSGSIPSSLGNCRRLISLSLYHNKLSGSIPEEVLSLTSLSMYLDLSTNELTGSISIEVSNLINLWYGDFSDNKLSGIVPEALGSCISLENLSLQGNSFEGTIPQSLASLKAIRILNLSHNNLTGQIPKFLEDFKVIENLDLSFNDFEGEVPTKGVFMNATAMSIQGNQKLCGGISQLNLGRCMIHTSGSSVRPVLIVAISCGILGAILVLLGSYFCYRCIRKKQAIGSTTSFDVSLRRVSYEELFKATNGFSPSNLVGEGGFGMVYKGVLTPDDKVVAIKVLNLLHKGASKSFMSECGIVTGIRHRNLVQVITACSSIDFQGNDFKALVYEFMTGGNLEEWLHPTQGLDQSRKLNFMQRLNISIDVASALDYLHHQGDTPIVHCDLKPRNILVDDDMTAHVGDFGLSRIIPLTFDGSNSHQSSTIGIKGSIGYIAPEYATGSEVSTQGDVYSYGVLLLEMFTGRRPTDGMFHDELNLHKLARLAIPNRIQQIFDPMLLAEVEEKTSNVRSVTTDQRRSVHECLAAIIKIGVDCSAEMPSDRLNISTAAAELKKVRNIVAKPLH